MQFNRPQMPRMQVPAGVKKLKITKNQLKVALINFGIGLGLSWRFSVDPKTGLVDPKYFTLFAVMSAAVAWTGARRAKYSRLFPALLALSVLLISGRPTGDGKAIGSVYGGAASDSLAPVTNDTVHAAWMGALAFVHAARVWLHSQGVPVP